MGLLNKKEENADDELLEETIEEGTENQEPEPEPEPETPAEVIEARDGARVCTLINRAIQGADALAEGIVFAEGELEKIKEEAAKLAALTQGLWQAVDSGALEAGSEVAARDHIMINQEQLGQLIASVIVDARDKLQDLLGQVDDGSTEEAAS